MLLIINNIFITFEPFIVLGVNSLKVFLCLITYFIYSTYYSKRVHAYCEFVKFNFLISSRIKTCSLYFSLFWTIFYININGLYPWFLCFTSHLSIRFRVGIFFWSIGTVWQLTRNFVNIIAHITPKGTPIALICFLVVIERISKVIQPVTLSLRLTANIIAGHIILDLISSSTFLPRLFALVGGHCLLLIVMIIEIMVSLIQSYVFSYLLYIYIEV